MAVIVIDFENVHEQGLRGIDMLVLFDEESDTFVEECYLSNYNEGDESKEIYLV